MTTPDVRARRRATAGNTTTATSRPRAHEHSASETSEGPFFGPVSDDENPAAHGNVTRRESCACGSSRLLNINGRHRETGDWSPS